MTRKLHGVERLHACAGILRLTEKLNMSTLELQDQTCRTGHNYLQKTFKVLYYALQLKNSHYTADLSRGLSYNGAVTWMAHYCLVIDTSVMYGTIF